VAFHFLIYVPHCGQGDVMNIETELIGAKVDEVGRIIFSPEPAARKTFFEAVYATPIGKEFLGYRTPESMARLAEILQQRFLDRGRDILVDDAVAAIRDLLMTRDPSVIPLVPEPAAVVEDTRRRHADGTFKSEHEIWASDPRRSMKEIRDRAQQDPQGFGAWYAEQRNTQTIQQGTLHIAGSPSRTANDADRRLLGDFVTLYRSVPTNQLKPRGGRIILDATHSYTPQQFEELVSEASRAGLL
jgi:hypothetical protein